MVFRTALTFHQEETAITLFVSTSRALCFLQLSKNVFQFYLCAHCQRRKKKLFWTHAQSHTTRYPLHSVHNWGKCQTPTARASYCLSSYLSWVGGKKNHATTAGRLNRQKSTNKDDWWSFVLNSWSCRARSAVISLWTGRHLRGGMTADVMRKKIIWPRSRGKREKRMYYKLRHLIFRRRCILYSQLKGNKQHHETRIPEATTKNEGGEKSNLRDTEIGT